MHARPLGLRSGEAAPPVLPATTAQHTGQKDKPTRPHAGPPEDGAACPLHSRDRGLLGEGAGGCSQRSALLGSRRPQLSSHAHLLVSGQVALTSAHAKGSISGKLPGLPSHQALMTNGDWKRAEQAEAGVQHGAGGAGRGTARPAVSREVGSLYHLDRKLPPAYSQYASVLS